MNNPTTSRRGLMIASLSLLASAGVAFAAVCSFCQGSGTGTTKCITCKGAGENNGIKCNPCNCRGWSKCASCRGPGQQR